MSELKFGKEIKTDGDMSNLIIGIILRQTKPYTERSVFNLVKESAKGSSVFISNEELMRTIRSNIEVLEMNGRVKEYDGKFFPQLDLIFRKKIK